MKRTIISAAVLALGLAGAGVSFADPGPNGHNDYGLCKAYENNSQAAKDHGVPFQDFDQSICPGTPGGTRNGDHGGGNG